jgi:SAM-dependent methyltransferase
MAPPEKPVEKPLLDTAAEDWSGEMGERWLKNLDRFEGMIAPVGRALLERAAFRAGERVLDIGCGAGATSLEIANRLGVSGAVLGLDISPALVAAAERRARAAGAGNLSFRCADAATASLEGPAFDRLFSRFGVMFFPDARGAFANLHRFVRPGGRTDFSVWAPARENMWIAQTLAVIGEFVELPPAVPRSPGPFALDDPAYVRELLEGAGFTSVGFETWRGNQPVGGPGASPEDAVTFVFDAMSLGRMLDEAQPEARSKVRGKLRELYARHLTPQGILMPGTAYLVTARS